MTTEAHMFTPTDSTLQARAKALNDALTNYRNLKACVSHVGDELWMDRIGTKEELEYAYKVSINTFQHALKTFSSQELYEALEHGLISENDLREVQSIQRQKAQKEDFMEQSVFDILTNIGPI